MTVIAGASMRWALSPRIVTLPSSETSATVEDMQDTLLDLEDTEEGIIFPSTRETSGGESLGAGITVGLTMELQDTQIAFQRTGSIESGTVTTADTGGLTLIDTTATFIANGVVRGDWVLNFTDKSVTEVIEVDSETQLTCNVLTDGANNQFNLNDEYKVWDVDEATLQGGNFVAVDTVDAELNPVFPTFGRFISKASASSATSQNQTSIEYASFGDVVTLDVNSVYQLNGDDPLNSTTGNKQFPVNNATDAILIAAARGIDELFVKGAYTFDTGDNLGGLSIRGLNIERTSITINPGADVLNCEFSNATIQGTLDGGSYIRECRVNTLLYVNGTIERSIINAGITLAGGARSEFIDCYSGQAISNAPIIDMGGTGQALIMRNWHGILHIQNRDAASTDDFCLGVSPGIIRFDDTFDASGGNSSMYGTGKIIVGGSNTVLPNIAAFVESESIRDLQHLVENINPSHQGSGEVFYWNAYSGNDAFDGRSALQAKKTWSASEALVVSGNHDTIIALALDPSGNTIVVDNLTSTKHDLTLTGNGRNLHIEPTSTTLPAMHFTGNNTHVSGLSLKTPTNCTAYQLLVDSVNNHLYEDMWLFEGGKGCNLTGTSADTTFRRMRMAHNIGVGMRVDGSSEHTAIEDSHISSNSGTNLELATSGHEVSLAKGCVLHSSAGGWNINVFPGSNGIHILGDTVVYGGNLGDINDQTNGVGLYDESNMAQKVDFIHGIEGGRWIIDESTNQMVFYKDDNTTEIARFDLKDINGTAAYQDVFERARA